MVRLLQAFGHQAVYAPDEASLLNLFQAHSPDALLCDVMLGEDEDGIRLCLSLRRRWPKTRFLFMSGDPAQEGRAASEGFNHFLHKPVDPLLLRKMLEE